MAGQSTQHELSFPRRVSLGLAEWATPLLVALAALWGWYGYEYWQLDRFAVEQGAFWRVVSGHLAHQSFFHMLTNLTGVLVAAIMAPRWLNRWTGLLVFLALSLGVGLGIWFNNPEVGIYRGLSGTVHGWLMVCVAWSPFLGPWFKVMILAGIQLKVIWEDSGLYEYAQFSGYFSDAEVLTDAHWYGVLLALPIVLTYFVWRTLNDRTKD